MIWLRAETLILPLAQRIPFEGSFFSLLLVKVTAVSRAVFNCVTAMATFAVASLLKLRGSSRIQVGYSVVRSRVKALSDAAFRAFHAT